MNIQEEEKAFIKDELRPYLEKDDLMGVCNQIDTFWIQSAYSFDTAANIVNFLADLDVPIEEAFDEYFEHYEVFVYDVRGTLNEYPFRNWEFLTESNVTLLSHVEDWEDDDIQVMIDAGLGIIDDCLYIPADSVLVCTRTQLLDGVTQYCIEGKKPAWPLEGFNICYNGCASIIKVKHIEWSLYR